MKRFLLFILMFGFLLVGVSCKKDEDKDDNPPIVDKDDDFESDGNTYYVFYNNDFNNNFFEGILSGDRAMAPVEQELPGHKFVGWYAEVDGEEVLWDFNDRIADNVSLTAKWEEITQGEPETEHEIRIAADLDAIEEIEYVDGSFLLPERGSVNNIKLVWNSSNPSIVTPLGIVNPPTKIQGDKKVVLTVSAVYAGDTWEKHFVVDVEAKKEPVVTEKLELPFQNLTNEYEVEDGNLMAFYIDEGNIPYVDVVEFLLLLSGLLESDELEFEKDDDILTISYVVVDEEEDEEYDFSAVLDFYKDTIFTEHKSFFSYYIKETATDYSEGINYLDTYHEEGTSVTFDLSKYQVDMFVHVENHQPLYLMPFNFLNMIFTAESYYNVYYNGDGFFGIYGSPSSNDKDDEYNAFETMKTSSLNNTDIPYDVALATYNQIAFAFDHYFGLRHEEQYDVDYSFYELLENNIDRYFGTRTNFNNTLRNFLFKSIDELHTSYNIPGYYNRVTQSYGLSLGDLGPRVLAWYEEGVFELQDSIEIWHGDDRPDYQFLDAKKETAVIYLDSFLTAPVGQDKTKDNDSDEFMKVVLRAIKQENPNVKNIGIDLSYNTGGNLGALYRVLGHITDDVIEMSYHNALDGANTTYFIELDTKATKNVNWFFITSPVTFSAANLMTAIVKNQNLGLIIGSTSGGGACSITPILLADGTMIAISSNTVISIRTENSDGTYSYNNIEYGIEPDVYLAPIYTQDINRLLDLVDEHLNN